MRILVRFLTRVDDGATEKRDKVFETSTLTLGRGTDQTLHLRDPSTALEHAVIARRDGRYSVRALTLSGIIVNDALVREAVIDVGDRIGLGDNLLTIIEPPPGYDFALTFELDAQARVRDAARPEYRTRIAQAGLRPRRWAWIAVIVVLITTLLLPASMLFNDEIARVLRAMPLLPDDGIWLSGPLHPAHEFIGSDCTVCHTVFRRTPNTKCMACHTDVQRHIPVMGAAADTQHASGLASRRCGACHEEHNEPAALIRHDQIVCTDCHAQLAGVPTTTLRDVSGFPEGHPGFRVTLQSPLSDSGTRQWLATREDLSDTKLAEQSGLIFPHDKHLDTAGIKGADGDVVMTCTDCHLPQAGGALMRSVDMQRDCQGCHTLDFEPADPQRQAPHAASTVVLESLGEYYAWRYLNGLEDVTALGLDASVFRRPGRIDDRAARDTLHAAAQDKARDAMEDLQKRTCSNCHEIDGTVVPVRLSDGWLPKARFNHREHRLFNCTDCHQAATSESATDVLIPDIDTCGQCHSGTAGRGKVASTCIDCHGFHTSGAGSWPH